MKALLRTCSVILIVIGVAGLGLGGLWLYEEQRWGAWTPLGDAEAFKHGTLGLEFAPLKYVLVMDELSGNFFRRSNDYPGWEKEYGFLPNPDSKAAEKICLDNAAEEVPVGISVSKRLPLSGAPVPVSFAGLTCAACHSSKLETGDGKDRGVVYGAGNISLDLIAWSDALMNAAGDPTLTAKRIQDAYVARCGDDQGFIGASLEHFVMRQWLSGFRTTLLDNAKMYDLPFARGELLDPEDIPPGPSRTRPFRSVVRTALFMPGARNYALSKVPGAFEQNHKMRPRSQYDGSIADYLTRSVVAAYTSGSPPPVLALPEIEHNVRAAARHSLYLGSPATPPEPQSGGQASPLPSYAEMFPEPEYAIDRTLAARGFEVYMQYCNDCHGHRPLDGGEWVVDGAKYIHKIAWLKLPDGSFPPPDPEAPTGITCEAPPARLFPTIRTDDNRLLFRYAKMLPDALWVTFVGPPTVVEEQAKRLDAIIEQSREGGRGMEAQLWSFLKDNLVTAKRQFPLGHPFYFDRCVLRDDAGYYDNPIPFAYLRTPYLHNGSIPTLAQLINLEKRPERFCRGRNRYDPSAVGIAAPEADSAAGCPPHLGFLFDVNQPGNANRGHDYPWTYEESQTPERLEQLRALLEYLKTL